MSLRWPKFLPRFPALLLTPMILGYWLLWGMAGVDKSLPIAGAVFEWHFPMKATVCHLSRYGWCVLSLGALLVDATLALAVAYGLPMLFDRLLFPLLRGRRRQEPATPPVPS